MMDFSKLVGTKYPDSQVMRWFFKEGLHKSPGSVLELGCGWGNNLMMFQQYGWDCYGLEMDHNIMSGAATNLRLASCGKQWHVEHGRFPGIHPGSLLSSKVYDAFMMPGSLYYVSRSDAIKTLRWAHGVVKSGSHLLISIRGLSDYRYARGEKVGRNEYVLNTPETGENGILCTFYHEYEIVNMMHEFLGLVLSSARVLNMHFENVLNGEHMMNHDIIVWGVVE